MNKQEEIFIKTFVRREKRDRCLSLLSSERGRKKFLERLYHNFADDLDPRYLFREDQLPAEVAQQVKRLVEKQGGESAMCHVICTDPAIDGQVMMLEEAVQKRHYSSGVILCVIPDKLAYYRTEDWDPDYVLFRA
jgi:hypothetical protein